MDKTEIEALLEVIEYDSKNTSEMWYETDYWWTFESKTALQSAITLGRAREVLG
jgi:hypothetical protein